MLTIKEKKRVAELHQQIFELEHNKKNAGRFERRLIPLYQEMQKLYKKQG